VRGLLLRGLGLLAALAAYAWWVEPARLTVTEEDVSDPGRPPGAPIRVLLLTDWHLGRPSPPRALEAKIRRLARRHRRQPFDLVLLGGDFLDTDRRFLPRAVPALRMLRRLGAPLVAVLGNHDYSALGGDAAPLAALLRAQGVRLLRNGAAAADVRGRRLLIIGLDDLQQAPSYYQEGRYRTPAEYEAAAAKLDWYARFDALEPDTPRLLLAHNPDAAWLPGRRPLAVLAGHTHGGQLMPLDWLSRPLNRWLSPHLPPGGAVTWAGRRAVNGRVLIVSRGLGGSSLPLRLGRPPEAVILTLR
jgi:predicted MPP superfamily phosphohydrolase